MNILKKVLIAFGLIIAIGIIQSGLAVVNLQGLTRDIDSAMLKPVFQVDAARTAWSAYQDANEYLVRTQDAIRFQSSDESSAKFKDLAGKIRKEIENFIRTGPSEEAIALAEKAKAEVKAWEDNARVLLGSEPAILTPAPYVMEQHRAKIKNVLQGLVAQALTEAKAAKAQAKAQGGKAQTMLIILAIAGAVLALGIAIPLSLALTRPLARFEQRMLKLIEGDVTSEIADQSRKDEIGRVAKALSYLKERLIERNALEARAAELHRLNEEKLKATETAYEAAGKEQAAIVQELEEAIESVARGNLTARITADVSDTYGKLKSNFNAAVGNLESIVKLVAATSNEVRNEADEIVRASGDLSRRTEQQAASLEETAGALEVIMTTVKKTADGATLAKNAVAAANSETENGTQVVATAIEAMNKIEKSSGQIRQIISVIDEIAFQTNLLALNAGVEAARAGESGRGFAVIATEVRALAQRAAEAAKEIKVLVENSTSEVSQGVELVAKSGKVLEKIGAQVAAISQVVMDIANGAKDQADGLLHVNTEVGQINLVTQQNAAMAEQSTNGTQSLKSKAIELTTRIEKLEISRARGDIAQPVYDDFEMPQRRYA